MVEIALCLAIIAFAMVAIMGVLPAGLMVQKANREDTMINQEGAFYLETIRNGLGLDQSIRSGIGLPPAWESRLDQLTNYVDGLRLARTNSAGGAVYALPVDRGFRIIGRLGTPKYEYDLGSRTVYTNTILAKIRPQAGVASQQGTNASLRGFAFSYLLQSEVVPYSPFPTNFLGTNLAASAVATLTPADKLERVHLWEEGLSLSNNLYEVRLTLRWPVFEQRVGTTTNWTTGPNLKVFRTLISGQAWAVPPGIPPKSVDLLRVTGANTGSPLYFFRPFTYFPL